MLLLALKINVECKGLSQFPYNLFVGIVVLPEIKNEKIRQMRIASQRIRDWMCTIGDADENEDAEWLNADHVNPIESPNSTPFLIILKFWNKARGQKYINL